MQRVSRRDDEHPYRKSAVRILEQIVQPVMEKHRPDNVDTWKSVTDEVVEIIHEEISAYRQSIVDKWVNEVVVVDVESLAIECLVHDVKVVNGYPEFHVKPLVGEGHMWVKEFRSRRDTPMKNK